MSISGTGSSTRPAGSLRKGRITKDRSGGCEAATASISASSARASLLITSSAKFSAILPIAACRLRFRCRKRPGRSRRLRSPAVPAQRPVVGPVVPLTASQGSIGRAAWRRPRSGACSDQRSHRQQGAGQGGADRRPERPRGRFQLAARQHAGSEPAPASAGDRVGAQLSARRRRCGPRRPQGATTPRQLPRNARLLGRSAGRRSGERASAGGHLQFFSLTAARPVLGRDPDAVSQPRSAGGLRRRGAAANLALSADRGVPQCHLRSRAGAKTSVS